MITISFSLNLIPGAVLQKINASLSDSSSRTCVINLRNGEDPFTIPDGCSIALEGIKPNKETFHLDCSIEDNKVIAEITNDVTDCPGAVICQLILEQGSKLLHTSKFIIQVEDLG